MNLKSFMKTMAILMIIVITNLITLYLTQSKSIDPELAVEITDKAVPIVIGVLVSMATMLTKSKALEATVTSMVNNGKAIFDRSASNMEEAKKEARNTSKSIGEVNGKLDTFMELLKEAISIKDTVEILNKKLDIYITNNPEAVKNGTARKIYEVDHHEE